ncbi:MAG: hypothetical protein KL787_01215 [Taibaiella sp.]|nr:hypothetical protein [Taibaiella sp.]
MKKVFIFFLSIICISKSLSGQDTMKIRKYFEKVHEATKSVVRNDYPAAIILYKEAFKLLESPFSLDVNNLIFALTESRYPDTAEIIRCLKILQGKGRCVHEYYARYPKIAPYCDLLDHKDCNRTNNQELAALLEQLVEKDQEARRLHPDIYHASVIDRIRVMDSSNYHNLVNIFRYLLKHGLRAEDEIGARGTGSIDLLLQHAAPWGFYNKPLTDSLILTGCLDSRYLASVYDHSCKFYSYRNAPRLSDWRSDAGCINGSIYGSITSKFASGQKYHSIVYPGCAQEGTVEQEKAGNIPPGYCGLPQIHRFMLS